MCTSCKIVGHSLLSCPLKPQHAEPQIRSLAKDKKEDGWKNQRSKKIWVKKDIGMVNVAPFACVDRKNCFSVLDDNKESAQTDSLIDGNIEQADSGNGPEKKGDSMTENLAPG